MTTFESLSINYEKYNCKAYVYKDSVAKTAATTVTMKLPCTVPPQPPYLWILNSGMKCLGLDPRTVLLKGISRPVKTSLLQEKPCRLQEWCKHSSGFVACNLSCTEIFQVIVTQAERDLEWKRARGPNSTTAEYIACFTEISSTWWLISITGLHAQRSTWVYAHIPLTTWNEENIKGERASVLFHSNSIVISLIHLSLCKCLIEHILLNFPFSLEHTYMKEQ